MMADRARLIDVRLDEKTLVRRAAEVEHERAVAIYDLLEDNHFDPHGDYLGPFALVLRLEEGRLIFDVRAEDGVPLFDVPLGLRGFQAIIKDYFLVCESYYASIRTAPPSRIEAIDMGRRALHNEGSEMLRDRLAGRIEIDTDTARRLFTLICVLHIRG
jgi:uncharacterized protein (UPF0262 family)